MQPNFYKKSLLAMTISMMMHTASAAEPQIEEQKKVPDITFDPIVISVKKNILAPTISEDDVYAENESSTYKDLEDLDRFMGESPSDIFKGMIGVESGDARNSGAIDPNVRGIQGQGRVPVTIDGTEQSITVWRGYAGANNRNYIDPLLISDVKVTKGASLDSSVRTSVGGGVAINTLTVDDVLNEDKNFGLSIKGSVGNNATDAEAIDFNLDDEIDAGAYSTDVFPILSEYDVPIAKKIFLGTSGDLPRNVYVYNRKVPETRSEPLSVGDKAVRIAMAGRGTIADDIRVDGLAAYTYRDRGNYFSGKHNADNYRYDGNYKDKKSGDYQAYLADVFLPGREVTNTSNEIESYLLKASIYPTSNQALQLGYRHTDTHYGDILPSRIQTNNQEYHELFYTPGMLEQWPLSHVEADAINLKYRFNPENKYIDLTTNLWQTDTYMETFNGGGYPYAEIGATPRNQSQVEEVRQAIIAKYKDKFPQVSNCSAAEIIGGPITGLCKQLFLLYNSNTIVPGGAYMTTDNDRTGFSLTNTSHLTDKLDMTLSGNWQKEKLSSQPSEVRGYLKTFAGTALPRKGRREEWDFSTMFNYQPTDKWQIEAGLNFNSYWVIDDGLNELREAGKFPSKSKQLDNIKLKYYQVAEQAIQDEYARYLAGEIEEWDFQDFLYFEYPDINVSYGDNTGYIENGDPNLIYTNHEFYWKADSNGNLNKADNIFYNGEAAANGWLRPAEISSQGTGAGAGNKNYVETSLENPLQQVGKRRAHAVDPSFATSYQITDHARVYARYSETTRMPSMFESTIGFSLTSPDDEHPIQPESGKNIELGYVQDLTPLFEDARMADIKLALYRNRIDDVIDRGGADLSLYNFDHQTIEGIELQSRYDNGDWFTDFSIAHTLKQEVCDAQYAMQENPYYGGNSDCVKYGFTDGYLRNMGQPDWQADLILGKRLMDEKFTIGTRLHYHSASDKDTLYENYGNIYEGIDTFNWPIDWSSVFTVDGFMNYKHNDNMSFELSGTNLTDQYYVDPLTRSKLPAPGKAVTAKAEFKF